MARLRCSVNFDVADLPVNAWKTVASIKAPANQMLQVFKAAAFPNGTSGDQPHLDLRLARITAASGTGSATTPIKLNNAFSATPQATARQNFTGTEPTDDGASPYLYPSRVHPQGAFINEVIFDEVIVKEGTEVALQVKQPTGGATDLDARGYLIYEE